MNILTSWLLQLYHNVTGLEEGFTYELAVSAFTEEGEGEKSSWEEARTRPKSVPNIMETPVVKVLAAKHRLDLV